MIDKEISHCKWKICVSHTTVFNIYHENEPRETKSSDLDSLHRTLSPLIHADKEFD